MADKLSKRVAGYTSLYFDFIKIRLMAMIEYREAFLWGALAQAASYTAEFTLIWIMINKFNIIGGWLPYEVILLFAFNLASYALAAFFFFNPCYGLTTMIHTGEFDEVLTKPINSLLYLLCSKFNYAYFSHLVVSGVVIILSFIQLGIPLSFLNICFLLITLIGGAFIQAAFFIFTSVPSFWLIQNNSLVGIFMRDLKKFIRYPLSIYPKIIQFFLTLIIPYAFISFYPVQFFLAREDFLLFHPVFQYLTPLVGIVLFLVSYRFWKLGIDHYQSTGS